MGFIDFIVKKTLEMLFLDIGLSDFYWMLEDNKTFVFPSLSLVEVMEMKLFIKFIKYIRNIIFKPN